MGDLVSGTGTCKLCGRNGPGPSHDCTPGAPMLPDRWGWWRCACGRMTNGETCSACGAPKVRARGLSLHQPYASLVAAGLKTLETRGHRIHYRGPVVICSTLALAKIAYETIAERFDVAAAIGPWTELPVGKTLALVDVVGCRPLVEEDWPRSFFFSEGRFAWELANVRRLKPKAVRGMQGLFPIEDGLIELEEAR